jgi:hypothetical protein
MDEMDLNNEIADLLTRLVEEDGSHNEEYTQAIFDWIDMAWERNRDR